MVWPKLLLCTICTTSAPRTATPFTMYRLGYDAHDHEIWLYHIVDKQSNNVYDTRIGDIEELLYRISCMAERQV